MLCKHYDLKSKPSVPSLIIIESMTFGEKLNEHEGNKKKKISEVE